MTAWHCRCGLIPPPHRLPPVGPSPDALTSSPPPPQRGPARRTPEARPALGRHPPRLRPLRLSSPTTPTPTHVWDAFSTSSCPHGRIFTTFSPTPLDRSFVLGPLSFDASRSTAVSASTSVGPAIPQAVSSASRRTGCRPRRPLHRPTAPRTLPRLAGAAAGALYLLLYPNRNRTELYRPGLRLYAHQLERSRPDPCTSARQWKDADPPLGAPTATTDRARRFEHTGLSREGRFASRPCSGALTIGASATESSVIRCRRHRFGWPPLPSPQGRRRGMPTFVQHQSSS